MKLSLRQILASTAGATLAAVIASFFGVKGTIVGVAIGSAAATIGTALVARSIERGHHVVQKVVGTADDPGVLRRMGDTGIVGSVQQANVETAVVESVTPADPAPTEVVVASDRGTDVLDDTAVIATSANDAVASDPPTMAMPSSPRTQSDPLDHVGIEAKSGGGYKIDWPVLAGAIGIVFVLTAICITSIALVTSYVTGNPVSHFVNPGPTATTTPTLPPATTTTSSSTTTSTTSATTSTTEQSTTTTTTTAGASTTTQAPTPTTTTSAPTSVTTTSSPN